MPVRSPLGQRGLEFSLQRREGCWREDLAADGCDDRSIALALVANLVPGWVFLECRPFPLPIRQRFPSEDVGQLIAGLAEERRPEADGTNACRSQMDRSWSLKRFCSFAIFP